MMDSHDRPLTIYKHDSVLKIFHQQFDFNKSITSMGAGLVP